MLVKLNGATQLLVILAITMVTLPPPAASTSPVTKNGCQTECGKLTVIRYPFGIGSSDCFYNEWFEILCDNGRPLLRINQNGVESSEVLVLNDRELAIRSNTSNMRVCENTSKSLEANLTGSPFYYSSLNKFMLVGSGTAIFSGKDGTIGGCTSISDGREVNDRCYGVNCCQDNSLSTVLYVNSPSRGYLTEFKVNYSNSLTGKNSCASSFMVVENWYPKNASLFSDPSADLVEVSVPVYLGWNITKSMRGLGLQNNKYCKLTPTEYDQEEYWVCECPCGFKGNPYIVDGCQDRYEDCSGPFEKKRAIMISGICLAISMFLATNYLLYKTIRRRLKQNLKEKRFKRNGGPLLQKYLSSNENIIKNVRIFTAKDLNKATDNFNENRVLGRGGQGTVYKGMLHDGKIVAVKKSKSLLDAKQVEEFINEIIILSRIAHRHVVKLFGCCLEMDVPLLVYEFIQNGTLYNLIHSENTDFPLSWEARLTILLEVAEALTYLHSGTITPVYHRDVKSSNILLDEKYKAKVADFGISRHIGVDQTHLTTLVKGTFGYLDPEYFQSSQFTEKSDVYSFGVVLVELLTGLKPICFSEEEESHLNLASMFLLAVEENFVETILDTQVKETSNGEEREAIIRLSQRCLNVNGRNRPTMKEIAITLHNIRKSRIHSRVLENPYKKGDEKTKALKLPRVVTSISSSSDSSSILSSSSL